MKRDSMKVIIPTAGMLFSLNLVVPTAENHTFLVIGWAFAGVLLLYGIVLLAQEGKKKH
jgi:ABC-type uncharacterized transport system permease subunit